MIRIWGDFNRRDELGRVVLHSADDMKSEQVNLEPGLRVIIWMEDIEAEGVLEKDKGVWRARIVWETLKDRETGRPLEFQPP